MPIERYFRPIDGAIALDIAVGANGDIFYIGENRRVYQIDPNTLGTVNKDGS
jgi:hypothetical protein